MSSTPPRRRLTRRVAPPRPTYEGAPVVEGQPTLRQNTESRRVAESLLRQAPYLGAELRRVATVTAVCLGLLGVLTIIDRVR